MNQNISKKYLYSYLGLLLVFSMAFLLTAWVAEDAFITFRVVKNVLDGHGPVWNLNERVQVYTHPLWFFLMLPGNILWQNPYFVVLIMSYICLVIWLGLMLKLMYQANNKYVVVILLTLILSRGFIDYLSSGLENPLLNVLIVFYVLLFISTQILSKKLFGMTFLISLAYLTRPDAIFFMAPPLLYIMYCYVRIHSIYLGPFFMGLIPFIGWEIFSIIYYGSFIPNTALAKVNTGYPFSEKINQSYHYFIYNFIHDPVTFLLIIFSLATSLLTKKKTCLLLSAGIILHICYITYVGADYMMGRFLSPLVVMAVINIFLLPKKEWIKFLSTALSLVCFTTFYTMTSHNQSPFSLNFFDGNISQYGLADERGYYYHHLGLMPVIFYHGNNPYLHDWAVSGRKIKEDNHIYLSCVIGMTGWSANSKTVWIDPLALSEPFLARLPAKEHARPGHYERAFPNGYFTSKLDNENKINDPELYKLYSDVLLATQGPIWTLDRWKAIWRLNTGYYKNLDEHFDRNATGLMELGVPVKNRGYFSCAGLTNFLFFRLD